MSDNLVVEIHNDYRYARTGYVPSNRKCDFILAKFLEDLPKDGYLPKRWAYVSPEHFSKTHGKLGNYLWAAASSSHLYMIGSTKILRVWTDIGKYAFVDVSDVLASQLPNAVDIPAGNQRKCKPFTKRVKLTELYQAVELIKVVRSVYGLDSSRVLLQMWK